MTSATLTGEESHLLDRFAAVVDGHSVDRNEIFRRLRSDLPIFFSERLNSWVVTRYDDVRAVLADEENFGPVKEGVGAATHGLTFLQMSGREHNKKAGIVARRVRSPRALKEGLSDLVESIARERAAALPLDEPLDLKEQYAMWIPLLAITELLALPAATEFRDWYRAIAAGGIASISDPSPRDAALRARAEVADFLAPIIQSRKQEPGDDLLSDLANAQYDGEPLQTEEIVSTIVFLLVAGVETTERVMASMLRHLALDAEEWEALRERRDDPVAVAAFAAEALRVYPPVNGLTRTARRAADIAGTAIAEGELLCVLLVSANRDESRFPNAEQFVRDRFLTNPDRQFTSVGELLPFGAGSHHCAGSRLAQLEMVHGFIQLAERVGHMKPAGELPEAEGFILRSPPSVPVVLRPPSRAS